MQSPYQSALAVVAGALAAVFLRPEPMPPAVWAMDAVVLADGPNAGEKFNPEVTPYLVEPLDFFADACPDNRAIIKKSKQTGFTTLAIIACGYTAAVEPCDAFLIEPTDANLADFNSEKLQRTIEASKALQKAILPQTSRSGRGSTTYVKRYVGGSLLMGIATSTADLRGKTRKKVIRDESSEYPSDLDGQGSPHDMITGAYESFLASGEWKDLDISTPVIKGGCHIDAAFEAGDKRYWHMDCPGCGEPFFFDFKPGKTFCFSEAFPYKAHYVTECCGTVIEHAQKIPLMRAGCRAAPQPESFLQLRARGLNIGNGWIATAPGAGKARSYHFDALTSPFVPWDTVAHRYIDARDNPAKLKTFDNLVLGRAHEVKGDAPDFQRLMERSEDYEVGKIPPRGLLLVAGADVQHSGIWYEIVAYASNSESWSVQHGFIEGETTDPQGGAFDGLHAVYDALYLDAFGGKRPIDAFAIDAGDGGRANQVYAWSRARHRAFAVKGMPGWTHPAIGTPTRVDIRLSGRKIKGGATLWPVGTWPLKATYYANLHKDGVRAGKLTDPPGYCHHHRGCDERYFKQQTSEYLKSTTFRGRSTRIWQENGPNHLLDCRVYAMAMAEYLGLTRMRADQWQVLAQQRGVPAEWNEPDLVTPEPVAIAADVPVRPAMLDRPKRGRRITYRRMM